MTVIHYSFNLPSRSPMPPLHLFNFDRGRANLPHRSLHLSTTVSSIFALFLHSKVSTTLLDLGVYKKEKEGEKRSLQGTGPSDKWIVDRVREINSKGHPGPVIWGRTGSTNHNLHLSFATLQLNLWESCEALVGCLMIRIVCIVSTCRANDSCTLVSSSIIIFSIIDPTRYPSKVRQTRVRTIESPGKKYFIDPYVRRSISAY